MGDMSFSPKIKRKTNFTNTKLFISSTTKPTHSLIKIKPLKLNEKDIFFPNNSSDYDLLGVNLKIISNDKEESFLSKLRRIESEIQRLKKENLNKLNLRNLIKENHQDTIKQIRQKLNSNAKIAEKMKQKKRKFQNRILARELISKGNQSELLKKLQKDVHFVQNERTDLKNEERTIMKKMTKLNKEITENRTKLLKLRNARKNEQKSEFEVEKTLAEKSRQCDAAANFRDRLKSVHSKAMETEKQRIEETLRGINFVANGLEKSRSLASDLKSTFVSLKAFVEQSHTSNKTGSGDGRPPLKPVLSELSSQLEKLESLDSFCNTVQRALQTKVATFEIENHKEEVSALIRAGELEQKRLKADIDKIEAFIDSSRKKNEICVNEKTRDIDRLFKSNSELEKQNKNLSDTISEVNELLKMTEKGLVDAEKTLPYVHTLCRKCKMAQRVSLRFFPRKRNETVTFSCPNCAQTSMTIRGFGSVINAETQSKNTVVKVKKTGEVKEQPNLENPFMKGLPLNFALEKTISDEHSDEYFIDIAKKHQVQIFSRKYRALVLSGLSPFPREEFFTLYRKTFGDDGKKSLIVPEKYPRLVKIFSGLFPDPEKNKVAILVYMRLFSKWLPNSGREARPWIGPSEATFNTRNPFLPSIIKEEIK